VTQRLAERYDVPSSELRATGEHPVLRLASLVAPLDFATVYLALAQGLDPTPVEPIDVLERGLYDADKPATAPEDDR
jgi:glucose/mannose-6-phosphate isomerase